MSSHEGHYRSATPLPFLEGLFRGGSANVRGWLSEQRLVTRQVMVGAILTLALLAFELFNFDTTEYALESLLGPISFAGIRWATILAVAFCSIDFAGLARLITADDERGAKADDCFLRPTWLLLAAWLLGGGMNAMMTWWAISLALMGHDLGNEVLTREQLLRMVPIFVAVLVWMTRILIISSFTSATEKAKMASRRRDRSTTRSIRTAPSRQSRSPRPQPAAASAPSQPVFVGTGESSTVRPNGQPRQGAKVPHPPRGMRPSTAPMRARVGGADSSRKKML